MENKWKRREGRREAATAPALHLNITHTGGDKILAAAVAWLLVFHGKNGQNCLNHVAVVSFATRPGGGRLPVSRVVTWTGGGKGGGERGSLRP